MHLVQRKYIKLDWGSIVVDSLINVVQEREFEIQVDSQEIVDGEVGDY
jgi:hypothetical protein